MFSPMGNKKVLLQMKMGLEVTSPIQGSAKVRQASMDISQMMSSNKHGKLGSMDFTNIAKSIEKRMANASLESGSMKSVSVKQSSGLEVKSAASIIASTSSLEKALSHVGHLGTVMNRIMESTVRYRPDRDAIVLKVFQSTCIEYELFRNALYSTFWLSFTDDEYGAFVEYFDPNTNGFLNGYDFMIAFTRLGGMRKDREAIEVREKQEIFMKQSKEDEERKKLEQEKKMEIAANFKFSEDVRARAITKLCDAAIKFDASHPSSPSVEGFYVNVMKPYTFRELIKLTFNLKVDREELGAILKAFDSDISETNSNINASDFLRYFLKLGFEGREKEKAAQRNKQAKLDAQAAEEAQKKLNEANDKLLLQVDYNYSAMDENSAMQKLRDASTKYDKNAPGSVSLDGFECESLDPGQFKDILRRVFNIALTNAELGFLVQKYDTKKIGSVLCKPFLTEFFRLGQTMRHKQFSEQLERQKNAIIQTKEKHLKKVHEVQNSEKVRINPDFSENDLQTALDKLTTASIKYDKVRGVSLESFEPSRLNALDFKKAVKRTFNLVFTPAELGAMMKYFDKDNVNMVNCADFLTTFTTLGAAEKFKIRSEQLALQRQLDEQAREEEKKKILTLGSKVQYTVDFECTEEDKASAQAKITAAATKYDAKHPSALGLDGFERIAMDAGEFKELVRRTFNLKLTAAEVGAVFSMFDPNAGEDYMPPPTKIDCGEFLKYFLSLGFAERSKVHKEQLERQRRENKEREEESRRKIEELSTRVTFTVDKDFTEEDKESIMEKINRASEGFDKNHPAAPSLEAFDVSHMPPGLFRENLKRVFNVQASPKEIGYLMTLFDKDKTGKIDSKEFMLKFQAIGKTIRSDKRKAFLAEKRAAEKAMKKEEEEKLAAQWEKAELKVDYDCQASDYNSALEKMTEASAKYDKMHPSAPSLDGFTGGPIKPGVFRELMKRAFNVHFTPKELGAVTMRNRHVSDPNVIDGRAFLIGFMKLGYEARARIKNHTIEKQRKIHTEREQEKERKLHLAVQRNALNVDVEYTDADKAEAIKKLKAAAVKYDKNSPGSVGLEAFDAAYLTPGMFREVIKRTLNLVFTTPELAAMLAEYDNGRGNVNSQAFVVSFIKMGSDERDKIKAIQLEKQRKMNYLRKTEHERKMKESEDKNTLSIDYTYTEAERESAFAKLAFAAKKYDKSHPGSMSLDGFEEKYMKAHVFREMLKRTFNVILTNEELASVMHYFDKKGSGTVFSKKFLIYFLKIGITEREKDHRASLQKLREDAANREREETEKLAAQWAKIELNLESQFTPEERETALEKLTDAALKFDPASPGPMGLTAFEAKFLTPAVFREMLKRSFNLLVTPAELAALVAEFDTGGNKKVDCKEFMVRFTAMGFGKRSVLRTAQLTKQRTMTSLAVEEMVAKQQALDSKLDAKLDLAYSDEDLHSALEKIRVIASNYDRAHASAPSLKGFMGTNMKPNEFKDMLSRTFHVTLAPKELTAIANYFPVTESVTTNAGKKSNNNTHTIHEHVDEGKDEEDELDQTKGEDAGSKPSLRVNNAQFLIYFNKIQREEQSKRRKERIQKERDLIRQEQLEKKQKMIDKQQHEISLLTHTVQDEASLVDKIRHAAQEYAVDSALYTEPLQGFKGPALPPRKFQDLFRRIFNVKLTFPELGVLLSILDIGGIGTFDGTRFLNWFYKLSRIEESLMLGTSQEDVTIDTLRVTVQRPGTTMSVGIGGIRTDTVTPKRHGHGTVDRVHKTITTGATISVKQNVAVHHEHSMNSSLAEESQSNSVSKVEVKEHNKTRNVTQKPTVSHKTMTANDTSNKANNSRYPYFFEDEFGNSSVEGDTYNRERLTESSLNSFTKTTLQKAWFLPSLTTRQENTRPSTHESSRPMSSQGALTVPLEELDHHKYLSDIFSATVENQGYVLNHSSVFDSTEAELNKQLISQLVGSTNKNRKSSPTTVNGEMVMTKAQARHAQQAAEYLAHSKSQTIQPISNDMVYSSLSSTGKLSAILTNSVDDSHKTAAKKQRLKTAPANSHHRSVSPLSNSQLLLTPLNQSSTLSMSKSPTSIDRTLDTKDFALDDLGGSMSTVQTKKPLSILELSQSSKHKPSTSIVFAERKNDSVRHVKPDMTITSQSAENIYDYASLIRNEHIVPKTVNSPYAHDAEVYAKIAEEKKEQLKIYKAQLNQSKAAAKLEQMSKQIAQRPVATISTTVPVKAFKPYHIHPIGKQKKKTAPPQPLSLTQSLTLNESETETLEQPSSVLMPATEMSKLLKPVEIKPAKPKEPVSDAGFFFPVLLSSLTPDVNVTEENIESNEKSKSSPSKGESKVLKGVPDIGPSGLMIARSTTTMLNSEEDDEGVSREQLRDIFNMMV